MDAIAALAGRHGLKIIEDCAHAPGAVYQSSQGPRLAGTLGHIGCFSFFSNKIMTTGEGGMVASSPATPGGLKSEARDKLGPVTQADNNYRLMVGSCLAAPCRTMI
jgi:hypothetical protein